MTKNYRISGPSTEAAVDSLIDEVKMIRGTHTVDVDAEAGTMTIAGEDFAGGEVEQAARNAGFTLAE